MKNPLSKTSPTRRALPAALLLAALALLAYANIFKAPFIYDDINSITLNRHLRMTAISMNSIAAVRHSLNPNRFLANLTLALNYYFHRHEVRGYHLVNLAIHIITALLVLLVTRQTLRLCGAGKTPAPFLAAALWLVNPVHTQSVTYTIQRMNSLAALFFLLAMACYIQARLLQVQKAGRPAIVFLFAGCGLSGVLGLASKEIAAALPVMIFLYEWCFLRNFDRAWLKRQLLRVGLMALSVAVLSFFYLGADPLNKLLGMFEEQAFTPAQRLLTEPGVVLYYISLLLFPHPRRLTLLYDFPLSRGLTEPAVTLLSLTALAMLLLATVYKIKQHRLLSFAVIWFLGNLVIESSFFGLALAFEHRTYLPSVFLIIAPTALLLKSPRTRALFTTILCIIIAVCAWWTCQRNRTWNDPVRFWRDNAAKAPGVPEVNNNLGQALLVINRMEEAASFFTAALTLDPGLESARINLGVALQRLGRPAPAIAQYRAALNANPRSIKARFNLAMLLHEHGRTEAAISQMEKILAIDPRGTGAMLNLGTMLMERQQDKRALEWFEKAAALDPEDPRISNNRGIVLHRLGRTAEALAVFQKGLVSNADNALLHNGLGVVLMDEKRYEQAADHFRQALAADPKMAEARHNLGFLAEQQGRIDLAVDYYRQALGLSPAYHPSRCHLAALLLETGRPAEALPLLPGVTADQPDSRPALNRLVMALVKSGELRQAAGLVEKMAAAAPNDVLVHYNLACLYARQDDSKKALASLEKAMALGYDNRELLATDPDLDSLRTGPGFRKLIKASEPDR